jgi:hypothetical protein
MLMAPKDPPHDTRMRGNGTTMAHRQQAAQSARVTRPARDTFHSTPALIGEFAWASIVVTWPSRWLAAVSRSETRKMRLMSRSSIRHPGVYGPPTWDGGRSTNVDTRHARGPSTWANAKHAVAGRPRFGSHRR